MASTSSYFSSATSDSAEEALEELKIRFLSQTVRIKITDGRVIEGEFQCMDKNMNFILGNATEFYGTEKIEFDRDNKDEVHNSRNLGMVMIPGKHVSKCVAVVWDIEQVQRQ